MVMVLLLSTTILQPSSSTSFLQSSLLAIWLRKNIPFTRSRMKSTDVRFLNMQSLSTRKTDCTTHELTAHNPVERDLLFLFKRISKGRSVFSAEASLTTSLTSCCFSFSVLETVLQQM